MDKLSLSYVSIIFGIICFFFIIITVLTIKKNKKLSKQLRETTITLDMTQKKLAELHQKNREIEEFHDSLKVAELTTKLQKPRLNAQINETSNSTPGKYATIEALAQKGMPVEEIAMTLAISTHEAQQLVNLSRLAKGNSPDNVQVDI